MSWRFSRELAAEYLADTCSDGELSALSRRTTTPQAYCSPDRMKGCSRLSRFGMTYEPLTDDLGAELLTWFLAGFPARTSASPEAEKDSTAPAPASGRKWLASWAKYDRATSSWKTAQLSFLEDLGASSVTWPRSGLMRRGECYPLRTVGRGTRDNASGLLPTLCTVDTGSMFNRSDSDGAALRPTLGAMAKHGLWPTLISSDGSRSSETYMGGNLTLIGKIHAMPTLCSRDYRGVHRSERSKQRREESKRGVPLNEHLRGLLNPTWCEWFMGFPIGWTELKGSGTRKFQEWRQQHSPNCRPSLSDAA